MEQYNIRSTDGKESGLMPLDDLKKLVQEGKLKGTTMVFTTGSNKWRLAASISEVRDIIREFDATQDSVLDRIRTEGAASNTVVMKARRKERLEGGKKSFWGKILGSGDSEKK